MFKVGDVVWCVDADKSDDFLDKSTLYRVTNAEQEEGVQYVSVIDTSYAPASTHHSENPERADWFSERFVLLNARIAV